MGNAFFLPPFFLLTFHSFLPFLFFLNVSSCISLWKLDSKCVSLPDGDYFYTQFASIFSDTAESTWFQNWFWEEAGTIFWQNKKVYLTFFQKFILFPLSALSLFLEQYFLPFPASNWECFCCCCFLLFCFFLFFFFSHAHSIWKFLGQGLNLSWSCDLLHSCSNARSLTHCAWLGIEPAPPQRQVGSLTHCSIVETPWRCFFILHKQKFRLKCKYLRESQFFKLEPFVFLELKIAISLTPETKRKENLRYVCIYVWGWGGVLESWENSQLKRMRDHRKKMGLDFQLHLFA